MPAANSALFRINRRSKARAYRCAYELAEVSQQWGWRRAWSIAVFRPEKA